ncbi:MAG: translation elongation factor Ts [Rickettsia sp.]|nr:translation elongation factor Ts [Rickettsia sp.]
MKIQASLVKELRDKTGLAMMLCKKALESSQGNFENALDFLKKQNKLVKHSSSSSKEGVISISIKENSASIIEINSNTDFVARNDKFQNIVKEISDKSLDVDNLEDLFSTKSSNGNSIKNFLIENSNIIGEQISLSKMKKLFFPNSTIVGSYIHNKIGENMGKMASVVSLKIEKFDNDVNLKQDIQTYADQIAMHVVASKPLSIDEANLDKSFIEKEKEIFIQHAKEKSDKDAVIENVVKGKLKKLFTEVVLLNQFFVVDNNFTIRDFLDMISKKFNTKISILDFCRMEVGEDKK